MYMAYEHTARMIRKDELAPEETRNIPFFGFITGTILSLALWAAIAWTVWAMAT